MSKTRKPSPKKRMKSLPILVKYKLGGRKGTKSAQSLTDAELLAMLAKPTRKRDRPMLQTLVYRRKLSVAPVVESPVEEALTEA